MHSVTGAAHLVARTRGGRAGSDSAIGRARDAGSAVRAFLRSRVGRLTSSWPGGVWAWIRARCGARIGRGLFWAAARERRKTTQHSNRSDSKSSHGDSPRQARCRGRAMGHNGPSAGRRPFYATPAKRGDRARAHAGSIRYVTRRSKARNDWAWSDPHPRLAWPKPIANYCGAGSALSTLHIMPGE